MSIYPSNMSMGGDFLVLARFWCLLKAHIIINCSFFAVFDGEVVTPKSLFRQARLQGMLGCKMCSDSVT